MMIIAPTQSPAQTLQFNAAAVGKPSAKSQYTMTVSFAPSPPEAGKSEAVIVTIRHNGMPVQGAKVTADIAMVSMDMGTQHPAFKAVSRGTYRASVTFGMGGTWRVDVHGTVHKTAMETVATVSVSP